MPYLQHWNLPHSVRQHLDEDGQKVFQRAHNIALREYDNEVSANLVAWHVVKEAGYLDREDQY